MHSHAKAGLLLYLSLFAIIPGAAAMVPDEIILIRSAADRGNSSAAVLLAVAYMNGDGGLTKDPAAAAHWFEAAALQGNGYAQDRLADLYAQGFGVNRNVRLALDWREKAADRGIVQAQLKLGKMYVGGQGIESDAAKARYWLERAATEGDAEAQFLLGRMYHTGEVMEPNPPMARSWLEKAANRGYESAVSLLHLIESLGYQVDEGWYHRLPGLHKLAEDGDIEAQFQLAQRYEHGIGGVKRDAQAALLWYRRAAAAGHPTAKKALEQMSAQPGSTN